MTTTTTVIGHNLISEILTDLGLPAVKSPKWGAAYKFGSFGLLAKSGKHGCPTFHLVGINVSCVPSTKERGELPGRVEMEISADNFDTLEDVEIFLAEVVSAAYLANKNDSSTSTTKTPAAEVRVIG